MGDIPIGPDPAGVLEVATVLHLGLRRSRQEDRLSAGPGWWVVADGMGGEGAGDLAAEAAVDAAVRILSQSVALPRGEDDATAILQAVGDAAQQAVVDAAFESGELKAGCTLLVALAGADKRLHVGWVGDSRAYLFAGRGLELKTQDHSLDSSPDRAAVAASPSTNPSGGGLTRHLGYRARPGRSDLVILDVVSFPRPDPGRLLLCSDGVWASLSPSQLREVLALPVAAHAAAQELLDRVIRAGAPDNIALVLTDFGAPVN